MTNRTMAAKYKKLAAGRRKAYLKRPKSAGPTVGWLDWIHGRAREMTAFEKWFFGEASVSREGTFYEPTPEAATAASALQRRSELQAKGDDKAKALWIQSSKEALASRERKRKKLEQALGFSSFNYISLTEVAGVKYCLLWKLPDQYYIVMKVGYDDIVWRSIQYKSRHDAMTKFIRKRIIWKETIELQDT